MTIDSGFGHNGECSWRPREPESRKAIGAISRPIVTGSMCSVAALQQLQVYG